MSESSFDAVLAASRQVAEKIKSLQHDLDRAVFEIKKREEEILLHQSLPLPECDLQDFFLEYVDAVAARGAEAFASHLTRALYPERYGPPVVTENVLPLSLAEIDEVLRSPGGDDAGWLVDHVPLPLPLLSATGDNQRGREILIFILADQIRAAIGRLADSAPLRYVRKATAGLPLAPRRARIAALESEIAALQTEAADTRARISALKGGAT